MAGLYWDHVGIDGLSWPALWLEKQIVVPLLVHTNGVFYFHLLYLFAFILLTLVPQRV